MININLYKAMLSQARFDIDVRCVAYRYNMYDILHLVLDINESCLKYNDKIYLLDFDTPSASYVYYDRYTNCKYTKTKRIPKRLINNIRRKIGM